MHPVTMQRVALLAPRSALRPLLVNVADQGTVAFDEPVTNENPAETATPAAAALQRLQVGPATAPALAQTAPELDRWEQDGRVDLIAGEAELEQRAAQALTHGSVAALAGWMPANQMNALAERVSAAGGAVVPMPRPTGVDPPTLLPKRTSATEFASLVETYTTVPYRDVNPARLAGIAYIVMFGMMFADVGHGALLLLAAIAIRQRWSRRLARLQQWWAYFAGAGLSSIVFGALYGEFFGPTHVVPVIWLVPLDEPVRLLESAVAFGAFLLAGAYALGTVNRFREGGWRAALYAPSGLAGMAVFLGLGFVAGGVYWHNSWLVLLGGVTAAAGLVFAFVGYFAAAGGGGSGAVQAGIELIDLVTRIGTNLVSFARLGAFGLTHAALCGVVWEATSSAWRHGVPGAIGAVVIFVIGNAFTFALEGLVAGIQALRLEYYEIFSRVFDSEGRPFKPWHVPLTTTEVPC